MTKKKVDTEMEADDTQETEMKLYLVQGSVRAQYNPTTYNETNIWKIVRASNYTEAMDKFKNYFQHLGATEGVNYVVNGLIASEEIQ